MKSEYSQYLNCSFLLTCFTARAPTSFMDLFMEDTINVVTKMNNTDQAIQYTPFCL